MRYTRSLAFELRDNARGALKYAFLPAVSNCLTTYCHIRNANRSSTLVFFFTWILTGYTGRLDKHARHRR